MGKDLVGLSEAGMTYFYEIRDSNRVLVGREKGFATEKAAIDAGRKKARRLKASGEFENGIGSVAAGLEATPVAQTK